MLALGLVTTGVLAILSVYAMGLRQSAESEKMLKATETARELMEQVLELDFAAIPDVDITFDGRAPDPPVSGFPPPPYPGDADHKAYLVVDQVGPGLKSVYVRVYYGTGRSVDFQTYVKPD